MDISAILPGDIIEAEMRGALFLAIVEERLDDDDNFDLKIKPVQKHITNYHVSAHDVKAHFKKMGRRRGRPPKTIEAPEYDENGRTPEPETEPEKPKAAPRQKPGSKKAEEPKAEAPKARPRPGAKQKDEAPAPASAAKQPRPRPGAGKKPANPFMK